MTRGDKVVTRWYSERVEREVTLVRWGSFGRPVVLFPTAGITVRWQHASWRRRPATSRSSWPRR